LSRVLTYLLVEDARGASLHRDMIYLLVGDARRASLRELFINFDN